MYQPNIHVRWIFLFFLSSLFSLRFTLTLRSSSCFLLFSYVVVLVSRFVYSLTHAYALIRTSTITNKLVYVFCKFKGRKFCKYVCANMYGHVCEVETVREVIIFTCNLLKCMSNRYMFFFKKVLFLPSFFSYVYAKRRIIIIIMRRTH